MIEWVTEGSTVNKNYRLEFLSKLRKQVRKNVLELWVERKKKKKTSMVCVRERTILTERPPLVG
jgi:hypothetical protein